MPHTDEQNRYEEQRENSRSVLKDRNAMMFFLGTGAFIGIIFMTLLLYGAFNPIIDFLIDLSRPLAR